MNGIFAEMLSKYGAKSTAQYEQAFKEVIQEYALCGLSRSGFFDRAAFTGGTALRILHGMGRFSEDLDFSLTVPDPHFDFTPYIASVKNELGSVGIDVEIANKSGDSDVKSAFLKTDTHKLLLSFSSLDPQEFQIPKSKKTKVKLEIDTNPPKGAGYACTTRPLPAPHKVLSLDRESMFALKMHAILCRGYLKGRDYYDYLWFVKESVHPNLKLLTAALAQTSEEYSGVSEAEALDALQDRFRSVDVSEVRRDVEAFLDAPEEAVLWNNRTFLDTLPFLSNMENSDPQEDHEEMDI